MIAALTKNDVMALDFKTRGRKLIHYGATDYNPFKVGPIQNCDFAKPIGGLWTSPVDSDWGWKDYCKSEEPSYCDKSNSFTLQFKSNSKILVIDSSEDLNKLPKKVSFFLHKRCYLNFELLDKEYDAIWLTEKGQHETSLSHPDVLNGWDCESVLIMNPFCVNKQVVDFD